MTGKELDVRQQTLVESLKKKAEYLKPSVIDEGCAILIDISSSMNECVDRQRHDRLNGTLSKIEAVKRAVPNLRVVNHRVMYGLVVFGGDAEIIQPLTINFGHIISQQEVIHCGGMTNMTAGIRKGIEMLVGDYTKQPMEKKRMILLSDGQANVESGLLFREAEQCKELGIIIDTIAFGEDADEHTLRKIATITGGIFHSAKSSKTLQEVCARLNYNVRYIEHKKQKGGE